MCFWQLAEDDGNIALFIADNEQLEAAAVSKDILLKISNGVEPHDICILCKQKPQDYASAIIEELEKHGVRARIETGYQDLIKEPIVDLFIKFMICADSRKHPNEWTFIEELLVELWGISGMRENDTFDEMQRKLSAVVNVVKKNIQQKLDTEQWHSTLNSIIDFFGIGNIKAKFPAYKQGTYFMNVINQFESLFFEEYVAAHGVWNLAIENFRGDHSVPIMTIHKSKGLEFPICIIGGMGHAIHVPDKSILTIHPDIAMVMPVVDNEKRTKKKTIYTHYLKYINAQDELGEAMRKLYVAMTRAKEKLILLGCAKNTDSAAVTGENRQKIKTFFDMVLPAVHIRTDLFHLVEVETDDLILQVEHGMVQETVKEQALYNFDTTICYDKSLQEMYEWMDAADEPEPEPLPVKVSVSDLKIQSMEELDMEDFTILTHEEKEEEKPVPAFMQTETKEKSANRGALYGTIWHQVMAVIDFVNTEDEAQIRKEVKRLVETGRLCESDTEVLNYRRLSAFFNSTLGRKMRQAQKEGRLYREQPFVMGYPARDLFDERGEDETVLVQGIIDGYYETDDGIVLMDYKTDSLKPGDEKVLISRYRRQMELYRDALEKMTGKKVVKCLLYSFSLSETIEC